MFRVGSLLSQFSRLHRTPQTTCIAQVRDAGFFTKVKATDLWKSVTSVSNAGRKKGRASGANRKVIRDLNRGQVIGKGAVNMVWPGLTSPVIRGKELIEQTKLEPDPERVKKLLEIRNSKVVGSRFTKLHPLERGWSGSKPGGRSAGPIKPIRDENFEDFKATIIQTSMVATMKGGLGRVRQHKAVVVVGNGNGLVGFGSGSNADVKHALNRAKNQAIRRQTYFKRFENHTVLHDFYSEYFSVRLIVKKKQKGYGLVCHRVIKEICKAVGITDIHVKLDGRRANTLCIVRAFLLGLSKQRDLQSIAEEKRLHVVEYRPEFDYFPSLVASPQCAPVRTAEEILPNEELDYDSIINEGKLLMPPKKNEIFFKKLPGWQIHLKNIDKLKNDRLTRMRILNRYGAYKSFLTIREEQEKLKAGVNEALSAE